VKAKEKVYLLLKKRPTYKIPLGFWIGLVGVVNVKERKKKHGHNKKKRKDGNLQYLRPTLH
jgi:hypothetical protein